MFSAGGVTNDQIDTFKDVHHHAAHDLDFGIHQQACHSEAQLESIPTFVSDDVGVTAKIGEANLLTILFDAHRPDHPAPGRDEVFDMIFGEQNSVSHFFSENSQGKFTVNNAGFLGWYDAEKPGDHYWGEHPDDANDGWESGHAERWAEAVRRADHDFDFRQFDVDGNSVLSRDELGVLIVVPQENPYGVVRAPLGRQLPIEEPLIVDGSTNSVDCGSLH